MSPSAKKPPGKKAAAFLGRTAGKGAGAAALGVAANAAINLLSDPKVREQMVEFGSSLSDSVRARAAARKAARAERSESDEPGVRVLALRQRRLEHRAENLAKSVEMLQLAPGDESAAALAQVADVVGRIRLALAVAGNLPLRRRISAQNEITPVLAELEDAVIKTTMPPVTTPETQPQPQPQPLPEAP